MPLMDGRTTPFPGPATRLKKKLGKRDVAAVDVAQVMTELRDTIVATCAKILVAGGAVLFGSTRDGGAMLVRCFLGGDTYEDYVTSVVEFVATLEALDELAEAAMTRDAPRRP